MCTACFSGCLSCHTCPLPRMLCGMHAPCYACPLPYTPLAMHAPVTHAPLPCIPPCHAHSSLPCTSLCHGHPTPCHACPHHAHPCHACFPTRMPLPDMFPLPPWTDKHLWKHYLRKLRLRALITMFCCWKSRELVALYRLLHITPTSGVIK